MGVLGGVARDGWYRGPQWDEGARQEFERRLARARPPSRPQYRRIKAVYLLEGGDRSKSSAARQLLAEVLEDPETSQSERVTALSMLGKHALDDGRLDDAERHLRASLDLISKDPNGSFAMEEVWLAEVLLSLGGPDRLDEALRLLDLRASSPPLLLASRFEMCVAGVKVATAARQPGRAAEWAVAALVLADAPHSGLANHPTLGLVETDPATVSWLREVAVAG